ncbi:MAG: hypothetical protein RIQ56_424, partial [Candidatus Parcubacteria bacterium]
MYGKVTNSNSSSKFLMNHKSLTAPRPGPWEPTYQICLAWHIAGQGFLDPQAISALDKWFLTRLQREWPYHHFMVDQDGMLQSKVKDTHIEASIKQFNAYGMYASIMGLTREFLPDASTPPEFQDFAASTVFVTPAEQTKSRNLIAKLIGAISRNESSAPTHTRQNQLAVSQRKSEHL